MRRRSLLLLGSLLISSLSFFFSACSEAPPELLEVYWQLNQWDDKNIGEIHESLSLWVHARDEDGIKDIESVYIITDSSELFWQLTPDTWQQVEEDGETWIGSNMIFSADLSAVPRGEYRIMVLDKAGDRSEKKIYIPTKRISSSKIQLPDVRIDDKNISVNNPYGSYTVWLYSESGQMLSGKSFSGKSVALLDAAGNAEILGKTSSVMLYTYNSDDGFGVLSGPWRLPGQ